MKRPYKGRRVFIYEQQIYDAWRQCREGRRTQRNKEH